MPSLRPSLSTPNSLPHQSNQPHCLALLKHDLPRLHKYSMAASVACSFFFDAEPVAEHGMPAQDACALCSKHLACDSDVFMYKGDTPFCSEDCRDEQMQFDARQEAKAAARRQRQFSSATVSGRRHRESTEVSVAS